MMAPALVRLPGLDKGRHRLENFIDFSTLTVNEILGVRFQKIVILQVFLNCPVPFLIVWVIGGILPDSFFLFFQGLKRFS